MRLIGYFLLLIVGLTFNRVSASLALRSTVATFIGDQANCAGVLVAPNSVLTAYHCTKFWDRLSIVDFWGSRYSVVSRKENVGYDLALLQLNSSVPRFRPISVSTDVGVGDPVILVGSADGEPFTVTFGYVSRVKRQRFENCNEKDKLGTSEHQVLWIDATHWAGSSGGGVYDLNGNLLGIVVRGRSTGIATCDQGSLKSIDEGGPLWAYAVGPDTLLEFLRFSQ